VELPGRGLSAPIIVGNRVLVTACTGYQQTRLHVLCFDAATGKQTWERKFWATGGTSSHPKTNMAAPTPVSDGKRIYALFATCDLACLDLDGNLAWYRSLVGDYPTVTNQVGMAASPTLWKDVLIVHLENAGESFGVGIDTATGQNRWKVERNRRINWTTPVVIDNGGQPAALFLNGNELAAYDPASGKKLWAKEGDGSTTPSPAAGKDLLLIPGSELVAVKLPVQASKPEVVWSNNRLRPATASPLLYQGRVYAASGAGILNCGDAKNGELLWQQRLKGPFSSSPVAGDGKVYIVNEAGTGFVVKLGDKPELLSSNELGETILATPAIAGGALFIRSDQHLWCIGNKK
jgi:outer membrane protein assembly factor BamB